VNVIRLYSEASLRPKGEANTPVSNTGANRGVAIGWLTTEREQRVVTSKRGDLEWQETTLGVRAAIGAMKPGNAGGAKGSRKMDE
jgi:hypothetical protein